jgi:hypothetical protein
MSQTGNSDRLIRRPRSRHVRFAPKADSQQMRSAGPLCAISGREQSQQNLRLFDHLVGAREHASDIEAEHLGGLEVYDQFVLGRRLHW